MELTGTLKVKLPIESGVSKAGKQWNKMSFVLQIKDVKFPKEVCLETLNSEVIQMVSDTSLGTLLKCSIDISSREYNGKYYTSASCWRAEVTREEEMEVKSHKGVQQMAAMHNQQYQRATDTSDAEGGDDLPF